VSTLIGFYHRITQQQRKNRTAAVSSSQGKESFLK